MSELGQGSVESSELFKLGKQLGLKTSQGKKALEYSLKCVQLLDRKQQDYGPREVCNLYLQSLVCQYPSRK